MDNINTMAGINNIVAKKRGRPVGWRCCSKYDGSLVFVVSNNGKGPHAGNLNCMHCGHYVKHAKSPKTIEVQRARNTLIENILTDNSTTLNDTAKAFLTAIKSNPDKYHLSPKEIYFLANICKDTNKYDDFINVVNKQDINKQLIFQAPKGVKENPPNIITSMGARDKRTLTASRILAAANRIPYIH
jgi:hypothetical protein